MNKAIVFKDLGLQHYKPVWDLQESLLKQNCDIKAAQRNGGTEQTTNYLLFVEHEPVYTLGKNGNAANVLISNELLAQKGIEYFHINRGGDITFHGPQQVVGYPIIDLENFKTDIGWYLRSLEEVIILTLAEYGLQGMRSKGETGVWLDADNILKARKICAMGIRCSRWITMHGFALNVNTDLNYFNFIIPCGIQNKKVTSFEKELGCKVLLNEVKEKLKNNFEKVFEANIITRDFLQDKIFSKPVY